MNKSEIKKRKAETKAARSKIADVLTSSQTIGKQNVICRHEEICVFTEIPTDGIVRQQEKVYVKCLLCDEVLPIRVIEQRTIEVPLYGGK